MCGASNCQMRFTHANRHCPDHPYEALKRSDDDFLLNPQPEEQSTEILKWLQKYREERQQFLLQQAQSPSPNSSRTKTPKRPSSSTFKGNEENKRRIFSKSADIKSNNVYQENCDTNNFKEIIATAMSPSKAARKGLMCEMDMNAGAAENILQSSTPIQQQQQVNSHLNSDITDLASLMGSPISTSKPKHCRPKIILWKEPIDDNDDDPLNNDVEDDSKSHESEIANAEAVCTSVASPVKKSFNPKKKWLREAWQEDLGAKPFDDYGTNHPLYRNQNSSQTDWQMTTSSSLLNTTANTSQMTLMNNSNSNMNVRPSVIILAAKDRVKD